MLEAAQRAATKSQNERLVMSKEESICDVGVGVGVGGGG